MPTGFPKFRLAGPSWFGLASWLVMVALLAEKGDGPWYMWLWTALGLTYNVVGGVRSHWE